MQKEKNLMITDNRPHISNNKLYLLILGMLLAGASTTITMKLQDSEFTIINNEYI